MIEWIVLILFCMNIIVFMVGFELGERYKDKTIPRRR